MLHHAPPRGLVVEVSQDTSGSVSLPPPPLRSGSNAPISRVAARRSLALNTAVPYVPTAAHLNSAVVPVTPSSLSSPFAFSNPTTAYALSAGVVPSAASRGPSPANNRHSGNFTMTYDPREWASGRQSVEARQRRDCYGDPLQTPPPPYTIPPEQRSSTSSAFSRAQTSFTSPDASLVSTPVTQETMLSGELVSHTRPKVTIIPRQPYDMRRATHLNNVGSQEYNPAQSYQHYRPQSQNTLPATSSLSFQQNRSSSDGQNLPPPPPRRTPPNVLPEIGTDTSINRFNHARRSTSAGPTPTAGPSGFRTARTLSNGDQQLQRNELGPTISLPGPPTAPPPPASRSRSAGGFAGESEASSSRQRPPRLTLRNSNLTPIPATPNSVASGASARPMPFPLRIDTGMISSQGKKPAVQAAAPSQQSDLTRVSQSGPSSLARRSAVRGPAARSSGQSQLQIRDRSKSISGRSEMAEPPSTTMSNNPWASALEQTRSPQEESLPESSLLPGMNSTLLSDSNGRSHTPPATPNLRKQRSGIDLNSSAQQAKVLPTPPLSQKPLLSANSLTHPQRVENLLEMVPDDFVSQAMQRHLEFLKAEQEANSDLDRLLLFTQFLQEESLVRKNRYASVFQSGAFDEDAARGVLFSPAKVRRASTRDVHTVTNESPSQSNTDIAAVPRNENGWWKDYRPMLSPIASQDIDESSRGRPASRWWESATGSQSEGHGPGVLRSKRESKYMSLSKKLLQEMEVGEMQPLYENAPWPSTGPHTDEKANPDAFGYYDETASPPLPQQSHRLAVRPSALDISRFITLPPPYPRHHPAVNNNHPDLSEYRTTVRMLSDLKDARNRQQRHQMSIEAMRGERRTKVAEIKRAFRANIQSQIADGTLSYAEAAEAEKIVKGEELEIERQGLQAEFDTLQDVVINPLHDQLNERIEHLGNSLQSLQRELFASAANQDPDQPVQEGDDVPELLEQLTQLKWLFEAREMLHLELFDLLSQRNDAYKAIVALPYHQTNNLDKIRDTEAFFEKDASTRHATFCAEALKRHELFLQFIEDNALRGIEMQSSAFWDVTPGLVELLQKIPMDTSRLEIHIPDEELRENPTYQEHPQQYLWLLVRHASKSSYQYIEGQINLYCLVHEVKTSSLAAHYKASKAQQKMAGDQSIDLADTRLEDEGELTDELKNRAAMIEEQWEDALGKYFVAVQDRVERQLQDQEAWEEIANDD